MSGERLSASANRKVLKVLILYYNMCKSYHCGIYSSHNEATTERGQTSLLWAQADV